MSTTRASSAGADQGGVIHVAAPAKINLYLHVVGRRADGYHRLDSLIGFAAIHDTISVRLAPATSVRVSGPFAARLRKESDNLVSRAAEALNRASGGGKGAQIRLIKRLPVASGIGGGSADAAATLKALARLWNVPPSTDLAALALGLGADVPMCLAGRAARAGGIGERLDPVPTLPDCAMVLVNPGVPLPTNKVFQARNGDFSEPAAALGPLPDAAALAAALAVRRNDLTDAAVELRPQIRGALEALGRSEGCLLARMSGSGATCFGLFADRDAARRAAADIEAAHRSWWVCATRLLDDASSIGEPDLDAKPRGPAAG